MIDYQTALAKRFPLRMLEYPEVPDYSEGTTVEVALRCKKHLQRLNEVHEHNERVGQNLGKVGTATLVAIVLFTVGVVVYGLVVQQ